MREMLKDRTVPAKQMVDHRLTVALIAAPQDMMMGSRYILDAVELHKAKRLDDIEDVSVAGRRRSQPLPMKPEPARLAVGNANGHTLSSLPLLPTTHNCKRPSLVQRCIWWSAGLTHPADNARDLRGGAACPE